MLIGIACSSAQAASRYHIGIIDACCNAQEKWENTTFDTVLLDHYWLPDSVVWLNKGYMVRVSCSDGMNLLSAWECDHFI